MRLIRQKKEEHVDFIPFVRLFQMESYKDHPLRDMEEAIPSCLRIRIQLEKLVKLKLK